MKLLLLLLILPFIALAQRYSYLDYHTQIVKAEQHIVNRQFNESLDIYLRLSEKYEHIFLRDIKVAAQLSAYTNDAKKLFFFLDKGLRKGWSLKDIRKHSHINKFKSGKQWRTLEDNEENYEKRFNESINLHLRREMKEMFIEDQKRALRVALTPGRKWRDRYTNKKFVPNNRRQVRSISEIIDQHGYPGEKIIGDKSWATVIISHNEHDTIYKELRPKLYKAFDRGELSAIDLAIIETWRVTVESNRKDRGFLIWNDEVSKDQAMRADSLRTTIGLRNVELNNKLIAMEKELKMNFYLSPFHGGIITIKQ
jgi:hypothetical protein